MEKIISALNHMRDVMKKFVLSLVIALSTISVAVAEEQRVEANVTALEFNQINGQYMPRPTFATIKATPRNKSQTLISFEMDGYGQNGAHMEFAPEFVDENIEVINKYLKWVAMAKEKGDLLDKEIATVKSFDNGPSFRWIQYKFHSGNLQSHYLIVTQGFKGLFGEFMTQTGSGSIVLDEDNAGRLVKRLLEFKDGKISKTNTDDYK